MVWFFLQERKKEIDLKLVKLGELGIYKAGSPTNKAWLAVLDSALLMFIRLLQKLLVSSTRVHHQVPQTLVDEMQLYWK